MNAVKPSVAVNAIKEVVLADKAVEVQGEIEGEEKAKDVEKPLPSSTVETKSEGVATEDLKKGEVTICF